MNHPADEVIAAFAAGRLDAKGRGQVEAHVDVCDSCRRMVAELIQGSATLPAASPGPGARPLNEGDQVARYSIVACIGSGAMGVVYAARDPSLDRQVALKLLHPRAGRGEAASEASARLLREARAMAKLSHPHVVPVFDCGQHGDDVFLAMELIEGTTLRQWLAAAPRTWREIVAVFLGAGEGLAAAHQAGLVHRDFKPDNVLVDRRGRPRLGDFGVVQPDDGDELTLPGQLVGTPAYMSPEQLSGDTGDPRGDQFSFAVALYEALYETRPWPGHTPGELRKMIASLPPAAPRRFRGPQRLRRVLERALKHDPADRYPVMEALLEPLRSLLRARSVALQIAAAVMVLAATAAVATWRVAPRCPGEASLLEGVWAQERRRAVDARLAAVSAAARPSLERARAKVDLQARQWAAAAKESCEALRDQPMAGPQTLRAACLEHRRRELTALGDGLLSASDDQVSNLLVLASALPPVERCSRPDAAFSSPPEPPPAVAAEVAELRSALARADVAFALASGPDLLRDAEARADRAVRSGYAPVEAEALLQLAGFQETLHRPEDARATVLRARDAAERGAYDELRLRAELLLSRIDIMRLARRADGEAALRRAEAVLDRLGHPHALELDTLSMRGLLEWQSFEALPAVVSLRQARDLGESLYGPEHPAVARVIMQLAQAEKNAGNYAEAAGAARRGAAIYADQLGEQHPLTLGALMTIASVELRTGDSRRAAEDFERSGGPERGGTVSPLERAHSLYRAAEAWALSGDATRARDRFDTAAAIGVPAGDEVMRSYIEFWRARVLQVEGRRGEARAAMQHSLELNEQLRGDRSLALADLLLVLSQMKEDTGDDAGALADALRSESLVKGASRMPPLEAEVQSRVGQLLVAQARAPEARPRLEAAWKWQATREPDPLRREATRAALAQALVAGGEVGRAASLLEGASIEAPATADGSRVERLFALSKRRISTAR